MLVSVFAFRCEPDYYVPSEAEVRQRFGVFITADAVSLKPILRNSDVDTMLASFCVSRSAAAALPEITEAGRAHGWQIRERSPRRVQFAKFTAIGKQSTYEIIEVRAAGNRCIALAWLEADGVTPDSFEESGEARWARREFWPHVDRATEQLARD